MRGDRGDDERGQLRLRVVDRRVRSDHRLRGPDVLRRESRDGGIDGRTDALAHANDAFLDRE